MCPKLLVVSRLSPKPGFYADFLNTSFISPKGNFIESETVTWDEERSNKVAMGGKRGGRAAMRAPRGRVVQAIPTSAVYN
jgi:hypothetical protein